MAVRKLVAGNWKMHGVVGDLGEITAIAVAGGEVDVALCLPATLIERAVRAKALNLGPSAPKAAFSIIQQPRFSAP